MPYTMELVHYNGSTDVKTYETVVLEEPHCPCCHKQMKYLVNHLDSNSEGDDFYSYKMVCEDCHLTFELPDDDYHDVISFFNFVKSKIGE